MTRYINFNSSKNRQEHLSQYHISWELLNTEKTWVILKHYQCHELQIEASYNQGLCVFNFSLTKIY